MLIELAYIFGEVESQLAKLKLNVHLSLEKQVSKITVVILKPNTRFLKLLKSGHLGLLIFLPHN